MLSKDISRIELNTEEIRQKHWGYNVVKSSKAENKCQCESNVKTYKNTNIDRIDYSWLTTEFHVFSFWWKTSFSDK